MKICQNLSVVCCNDNMFAVFLVECNVGDIFGAVNGW